MSNSAIWNATTNSTGFIENVELPSIIEQARRGGFSAELYNFRKAKQPGIEFFNPAVIRRNGKLWLVTRRSEFLASFEFGMNELMAFELDEDHLPLYGKPILVPKFSDREHFEDPRAFMHDGRWWLSACNFVVFPDGNTWTGAHQVVLELANGWQADRRRDPVYGKNGSSVFEQSGDEKNWLWFSHKGELHLIYMTLPHTVVRWDNTFLPIEEYKTDLWHPAWQHGQPRGGSTPILVGDHYISFFHSSTEWRPPKRRYHMGAYAFEARPPYQVTAVTPKPLLSGSLDDPWGEGKPLVVFPCAALHENGQWTVSLGVNDMVSARCTISDALLARRLSSAVKKIVPKPPPLSNIETVFA